MKKILHPTIKTFIPEGLSGLLKPALLMLVLVVFGSLTSVGQVNFVNSTSTTIANGTAATSISINNYDPGTAANKVMIVAVTTSRNDVTAATFDGEPLEPLGNVVNGNSRVVFFYMVDPPAGSATISATLVSDNRGFAMGVATFSNVDMVNPLNTFTLATGSSNTPTVSNVPTAPGSIVFSAVSQDDSRDGLLTIGSGQTELWKFGSLADDRHNSAGSTKVITSGTTTSMSYSHTRSSNWSIGAVSINPVPIADLAITKNVNNQGPYVGQTIQFTLTVTNNGPGNATLVQVEDLLPSGYIYVSHTASGTTEYNVGIGNWDIGTLNYGNSETLVIDVVVNASGDYTNTATITGNVDDDTPGNNSASATITLCQAGGTQPLFSN
ncbi:MAG: DUF11 domain-containing protein [Lentimicrobium sp.]|nr:DUF11 domain-containing protein [Lentimicrobium sp.]